MNTTNKLGEINYWRGFQDTEKICDFILHKKSARGFFLLEVCISLN